MPADPAILRQLRQRIAALDHAAPPAHAVLPFGLAAVDSHLPGGGLALGCLHEIIDGDSGPNTGTGGVATGFAAALTGRVQQRYRRPIIWIAPRNARHESLYMPGLHAFGLDPAELIALRVPGSGREAAALAQWAMEEALRCPAVGAVCTELDTLDLTASRRLQLAAEAGGGLGLLLRGTANDTATLPPTASVSRWRVSAVASGTAEPQRLPGPARWRVEMLRLRGAQPRHWILEWRNEETARGFAVAAASVDRTATAASEENPPENPAKFARTG